MDKIFEYIDAHKQAYLDELFTFLRCKSISTRDEGVTECAHLLADIMKKSGIEKTTLYETARHPVVYGEIVIDPALPTLLVYGHYDVQPPEPYELWESDPFEPTIRDGKIFCRGSSDNKAQLYAHIKGVEAVLKVKGALPINVKYLFEGEEEIGSPNLRPFIEQHQGLLKCDLMVYSDSHYHESGRPQINLGVKGLAYVEMTLKEANSDLHSMYATCVKSPVWRMVELLNTLKDGNGKIKIDGFYDDVRPLSDLEIETVKKIPVDNKELKDFYEIEEFVNGRANSDYYYNLIFEPTCNIAGLYAGYTGSGAKTILPNQATVKIDMRLVPDMTPAKTVERLKAHLDKHGYTDVEYTYYSQLTPSRTPIDHPYVDVAVRAAKAGFNDEPVLFPGIGGAAPDYLFATILNVPVMAIPYAAADQNNHAPNESMVVSGLYGGIRASAALIGFMAEKGKV